MKSLPQNQGAYFQTHCNRCGKKFWMSTLAWKSLSCAVQEDASLLACEECFKSEPQASEQKGGILRLSQQPLPLAG